MQRQRDERRFGSLLSVDVEVAGEEKNNMFFLVHIRVVGMKQAFE